MQHLGSPGLSGPAGQNGGRSSKTQYEPVVLKLLSIRTLYVEGLETVILYK